MAEVWGVYEGLKLSSSRGFGKVIINIHSKRVISAILNKENSGDFNLALIRQIRVLMAKHDVVKIDHTFCEANSVADELAKVGRRLKTGCKVYDEVSDFLSNLLHRDSSGLSILRVVAV
ncbi:uncharacterized protein LOC131619382 [Vicia villosa]|uniref:uncharacterized protein LOC131619382 n=1 Tax=Vicia villosa TaxID=3911 RepID=UPI00273B98DB|nr:uncharacterized protein LOC131619382 [Vicia villosa]